MGDIPYNPPSQNKNTRHKKNASKQKPLQTERCGLKTLNLDDQKLGDWESILSGDDSPLGVWQKLVIFSKGIPLQKMAETFRICL